jgi:hypothetical protein
MRFRFHRYVAAPSKIVSLCANFQLCFLSGRKFVKKSYCKIGNIVWGQQDNFRAEYLFMLSLKVLFCNFTSYNYFPLCNILSSVPDLNPDPDPPDPYVFGPPGSDSGSRGMDPDTAPDPSIIKHKY